MPKMKAEERRTKGVEAYRLHVRRVKKCEIARRVGVSRPTLDKLLAEQKVLRASERDIEGEREKSLSTYEAVIESSWGRLETVDDRSLNVGALHNNIIAAQRQIDEINGLASNATTRAVDEATNNFRLGAEAMLGVYNAKKAQEVSRGGQ